MTASELAEAVPLQIHGEIWYLKKWIAVVERKFRIKRLSYLCGAIPHLIAHQHEKRRIRAAMPPDAAVMEIIQHNRAIASMQRAVLAGNQERPHVPIGMWLPHGGRLAVARDQDQARHLTQTRLGTEQTDASTREVGAPHVSGTSSTSHNPRDMENEAVLEAPPGLQ